MSFQSRSYLEKHTGRYGTERSHYLQQLVTEFQDTANDGMNKNNIIIIDYTILYV